MSQKPPAIPAHPRSVAQPRSALIPLDPRIHAWRADLAASSLQGQVTAARFVAGLVKHVAWPVVPMRRQPVPAAGLETEVLFGEAVTVFEEANGWAWVQAARDRYVGYVPADALLARSTPPTHMINALGTFIYPLADIKTPPMMHLSLGSLVAIDERLERFSRLATGGYVVNRHIAEVTRYARDFAEIAERFVGTPYLWGGRSRIGLDCSGLLQNCLQMAGIPCPRDSDMQERDLGSTVRLLPDFEGLQRGDLAFWKGHVGIMLDGIMMVHANAYHMAVSVEPLAEAAARIAKVGGPITTIKRLTATVAQQTS
jgi:cell wall-associated NlpC family hydrolase